MANSPDNLEIEVKFHLRDAIDMQRRLRDLGATPGPNVFETNSRFDDVDSSLKKKGQLLRLRKDQACRLTFKSKPANADQDVKVYQELEVEVGDFDKMAALLEGLGFHETQIYEKRRRTFTLQATEICIDTMPYGSFIEIEGAKAQIIAVSKQLELAWGKRILENYLAIFEILRKDRQLPFTDVTFDNFAKHPVNIDPYLPILEAGRE